MFKQTKIQTCWKPKSSTKIYQFCLINAFQFKLMSCTVKSLKDLVREHHKEALMLIFADSSQICQSVFLPWKTCWFLSNHKSDSNALTAFNQINSALDDDKGPTRICSTFSLKELPKTQLMPKTPIRFCQHLIAYVQLKKRCCCDSFASIHNWQIEGDKPCVGSFFWRISEQFKAPNSSIQINMLTRRELLVFQIAFSNLFSIGEEILRWETNDFTEKAPPDSRDHSLYQESSPLSSWIAVQ